MFYRKPLAEELEFKQLEPIDDNDDAAAADDVVVD